MAALSHEEAVGLLAEIGAKERGDALKGILGSIEQTFDGEHLYPSPESRAAHLLFFIVSDHALLDGTKRGTEIIVQEYLRRNDLPPLPPQVIGRLLVEIQAGHGRAHQERVVAVIVEELRRGRLS
jgi:prophage maintenance system killer protein